MRIVQFKQLIQVTSIVAGVIGLAVDAGYASETSQSVEPDKFAATETVSLATETIVSPTELQPEQIASATFEAVALPIAAATQTSQSSEQPDFLLAPMTVPLSVTQHYVFQTKPLVEPLVDIKHSDSVTSAVTISESEPVIENIPSDLVNISNSLEAPPKFEPLSLSSADLGEAQSGQNQGELLCKQQCCGAEPEPVEPKIIGDLEPKINLK